MIKYLFSIYGLLKNSVYQNYKQKKDGLLSSTEQTSQTVGYYTIWERAIFISEVWAKL